MEVLLYIVLPFVVLVAIGGFYYESMTPEEKKKWEEEKAVTELFPRRLRGVSAFRSFASFFEKKGSKY